MHPIGAGPGLLGESDRQLLENLHLTEKHYLTRAAALLFHPDPECFFRGSAVKIGYFASASDLRYHDEVQGCLFLQVGRVMELLLTKYLKAVISYEGIHRVESLPMPEPALREVLLNAIVHRDYAVPAPIQIRVYDDRLSIWNPGVLPEDWTIEKLLGPHASQPYNPNIANAFFRAGEIEAWGRGIQRVFEACEEAGSPPPQIRVEPGDFWFEFPFSPEYLEGVSGALTRETQGETPDRILVLLADNPDLTLAEVAEAVGKSLSAVERASAKLVKQGRLRFVGPRKGGHWEIIGKDDA
jgi:ATP-dependent DNA helicase RecG